MQNFTIPFDTKVMLNLFFDHSCLVWLNLNSIYFMVALLILLYSISCIYLYLIAMNFFLRESFNLWRLLLMIALLSSDQDTSRFLG